MRHYTPNKKSQNENRKELSQKLTEAIEDKESIPLSEVVNRMNKVINE